MLLYRVKIPAISYICDYVKEARHSVSKVNTKRLDLCRGYFEQFLMIVNADVRCIALVDS